MQLLDWIIIIVALLLVLGFGLYTQTYMRSVADFLSAGRVARRYLLAIGKSEMAAGAVIYVAVFEGIAGAGFTNAWWGAITGPIGLAVAIMGFVVYRYRETRAMTLAQFFEIRYSRNFRLFMGFLGFVAGLLNFSVMPTVGAHLMVYFLGLPPEFHIGGATIQTFIPLMGTFLLINFVIASSGGILTVMMTNCIEGLLSQIFYVFLIVGLMWMFSWAEISHTLTDRPPGQSLINPMDTSGLKDFNIWWVLMSASFNIYGTMAWQNQSAYNSAPLTPHEARMSNLLGIWKLTGCGMVMTLLCICAMTYLHEPRFATGASQVHEIVSHISDPDMQKQMTIPIAVICLLPIGLKGALCAAMLLGLFGGDSSHLHSWSSVLIQDFILPRRKKPLTPEQHIRLLRIAIAGVALFVFLFGIILNPHEYIYMWWAITTAIFVSGAGVAIIGGLYWKKGTAAGAWAGSLVGSTLAIAGIIANQYDAHFYGHHFPLNGTQVSFLTMLIAVATYVVVSLLTCKENFNMDRMLHRGIYANIKKEVGDAATVPEKPKLSWAKVIGYDSNFTRSDKWIAISLFAWSMTFSLIAIFGTLWNVFVSRWSIDIWSEYWHVTAVVIPALIAIIITVWFSWGGTLNVIDLFKRLRAAKVNALDNGMVVDHQNLDESVLPDAESPLASEAEDTAVKKE